MKYQNQRNFRIKSGFLSKCAWKRNKKWNIACGLVIFLLRSQASIFQNCLRQIGRATNFFLMFIRKNPTFYLCSVCLGCKLVLEYFLDGLKWLLKFSILRLLRWKFCEFCRLTLRSKSSGGKSSNLASGKGWYLEDKLCSTKVIKVLNFHYEIVT